MGHAANFIDWSYRYFGAYSPGELRLFAECFSPLRGNMPWSTVLDVGSNVGHHSLFMRCLAPMAWRLSPTPRRLKWPKQSFFPMAVRVG